MKKKIIIVFTLLIICVTCYIAFSNNYIEFSGTLYSDGASEKATGVLEYKRYKEWIGFKNIDLKGTWSIYKADDENAIVQQEIPFHSHYISGREMHKFFCPTYYAEWNEFIDAYLYIDKDVKNCVYICNDRKIQFITNEKFFKVVDSFRN